MSTRLLNGREVTDHEARLAAARRMAGWQLGDPSWADVLIEAYLEPDNANAELDMEMGDES